MMMQSGYYGKLCTNPGEASFYLYVETCNICDGTWLMCS